MDVAADREAKILVKLAEKNNSNEIPKSIVLYLEKAFTLTLIKFTYFTSVRLNVRNSRFKVPRWHRDNTLDDSSCVFTYRMVRITGDAPSHCFALLHSRFGWNSRESSQPLLARRNAQPLGRPFTLSRDDLAFANVQSWSQISFADNKCDFISTPFMLSTI